MASEIEELMSIGGRLGHTGEQLNQFIREQQNMLREERLLRREIEKEKSDQAAAERKAQLELEKEKSNQAAAERKAQLELEFFKLQTEKEKEKLELELRLEEARRIPLIGSEEDVSSGKKGNKGMESWSIKLVPKFIESDVPKFFTAFEKVAKQLEWKEEIWPILVQAALTGRAQQVYASLDEEVSRDYDLVKTAILDAYELVPEAHRQRFRKLQRVSNQSYWEFARNKEMLLNEWLRSVKVDDFTGLKEILLIEDFKSNLPIDVRKHIEEFNLNIFEEVAKAADRYELTHRSSFRTSYMQDRYSNKPFYSYRQSYNTKYWKENKVNPIFSGKCYNCGKAGHKQKFCKGKEHGKVAFTVKKDVTENKEQGKVAFTVKRDVTEKRKSNRGMVEKDREMYKEFISKGVLKEKADTKEGKEIYALRDTGASHSCVLKSVVPNHLLDNVKEYILLGGFPNSVTSCPTVEMFLDIGYVNSSVKLAVVDTLPVNGVDILVGNETTRNKSKVRDIIQINLEPDGNLLAVTRDQVRREESKMVEEESKLKKDVLSLDSSVWNREDFLKEQLEDQSLKKFWKEAEKNDPDDLSKPKMIVREGVLYRKTRNKFLRQDTEGNVSLQIIVPIVYRKKLLLEAHENPWCGHFGIDKTFRHLVRHFWWPKVKQDVKRIVSHCHNCQLTGKPNEQIPKAPLQPIIVTGKPFSHLVLDIVGPLPKSSSGNEYLLTIIDRNTRYPEAIPIRRVSSKIVIYHLIQYFSHFGFPQSIQTDRGSCFTSKEFSDQLKDWNVEQKLSTPYHPESQGVVERLHQTIKNSLTKYCHANINSWDKQLPYILFALRSVHNVSLGFSPFQIIFGHEVTGPMEILKNRIEDATSNDIMDQWIMNKERLKQIKEWSQKNLKEAQMTMKERVDERSKIRQFQVGDLVLVLLPSPGQLKVKYAGPGTILRKVSELNYEVSIPGRRSASQIFHVNLLKLYKRPDVSANIQIIKVEEGINQVKEEMEILQVSEKVDYQWSELNRESVVLLEAKLSHLDKDKHNELSMLCNVHYKLFADKLGNAVGTQHEVKLKSNSSPIHQSPYKLNPMKAKEVKDQIDYMLQQDLIERSKSPWSSPVVLVPKKDGGYRLCIDYRKVNEMTVADSFPIPRIEECIEKIGHANYVSKIDLLKGYWQIPLAPEAKEISAFVTPQGLFQCKVMPFGMKNASSTFQRMMTEITSPLSNCTVYLDDIVVYNNTWEEHMIELEKLFIRLEEYNLVINLSKSEFAHAEIIYLGHRVGKGKISPKLSNVETILKFPVPSNRKQVRQFLGLCGYYRRYVANYADIVSPLTNLLRKEQKFIVSEEVVTAVDKVKAILSSKPILRTPDWNKSFDLMIDASNIGIGAVLCQEYNAIKHPVAYFSRKLNKHQLNYSTVEKECLALVSALQYFEIYITNGGQITKVFSDHNPLIYIHRFKNKNRRLMSWSWIVQEYNFQMHHIRGRENLIADALSRVSNE